MAGIERYHEHEIQDGKKSTAYQVKPMDLSAGLSLGSAEKVGQAASAGMRELARTGRVISEIAARNEQLNRKIQAEKDELFGDKFRREYAAELRALPVTLDQDADEAAVEAIRKKYAEILDQDNTISDNFRNRAGSVMDADFSVHRIGMAGERSRTAVKQNAQQLKGYMDEAIGFGDVEKALGYRKRLEEKGFAVAPEEAVRSTCTLNGLLREVPGMELMQMKNDIDALEESLKSKKGFLGMNAEHTARYRRELLAAERRKTAEENEIFLKKFVDGEGAAASDVETDYSYGLIDEETYNKRMQMIQKWEAAREKELRYSESQADKARKKAALDAKFRYLSGIKLSELGSVAENEEAFLKVVKDVGEKFKDYPEIQYAVITAAKGHFYGKSQNVWSTDAGKLLRRHIDEKLKKGKFWSDPWGSWSLWFPKNKGQDFQSARYLEAVNWAEGELRSGKGVDAVMQGFDSRLSELNKGTISAFLSKNFLSKPKAKAARIVKEGTTGTLKDGTRVIYRNGKWERMR